jgi:hypothetical protein
MGYLNFQYKALVDLSSGLSKTKTSIVEKEKSYRDLQSQFDTLNTVQAVILLRTLTYFSDSHNC